MGVKAAYCAVQHRRNSGSVEFVLPDSAAEHEKMKFQKQGNRLWQRLQMNA